MHGPHESRIEDDVVLQWKRHVIGEILADDRAGRHRTGREGELFELERLPWIRLHALERVGQPANRDVSQLLAELMTAVAQAES